MTDLTQFKSREQLLAFYLKNPNAIEFKSYMSLLATLPMSEQKPDNKKPNLEQ